MANPYDRLPAVTLYAEKEEVESAFRKVSKAWICIHCKKQFNLLNSMGQLECRQHPGHLQENGIWTCCGQKQYPVRWVQNWDVLRMYTTHNTNKFQMPYEPIGPVPGCQPCDHNTSDQCFTHKDAMPINDLSALLPEINKRYPFHMRKGFDEGLLRRCAKRKIVVPDNAHEITYMDNDGEVKTWTVDDESEIPDGIEIRAIDEHGAIISVWQNM